MQWGHHFHSCSLVNWIHANFNPDEAEVTNKVLNSSGSHQASQDWDKQYHLYQSCWAYMGTLILKITKNSKNEEKI